MNDPNGPAYEYPDGHPAETGKPAPQWRYQPSTYHYPRQPAPPAPKKHEPWRWIVAGLMVIAALIAALIGSAIILNRPQQRTTPTPSDAAPTPQSWYPPAPTTDAVPLPVPGDFKIDVTIIEEQCFGTAVCNISFKIHPTFIGTGPLPTRAFRVIYSVAGGDSPMIDSFTVSADGQMYGHPETDISTDGMSTITATPTQVVPE